jgi:uncharacterized protein YdeI (YjbR/CyaY-like superfamily)
MQLPDTDARASMLPSVTPAQRKPPMPKPLKAKPKVTKPTATNQNGQPGTATKLKKTNAQNRAAPKRAKAGARSVAAKLAKTSAEGGAATKRGTASGAAAKPVRRANKVGAAKSGRVARAVKATPPPADDLPILPFESAADWKRWLERQHKSARGMWMKLARKGSGIPSVDRAEAVDGALCYGWIDGQGRSFDEHYYLIKFTPRGGRSVWSKINRVKVQMLIEQALMKPAGLAEVERAQRDGRWDAAYDSPRTASVPDDLAAALNAHPRARASFAELNAANRYAILWQLQTAKKAETRARRISRFIDMLERGETLH